MSKFNIFKLMYKCSPLNFYTFTEDDCTVIKSINSVNSGYKFDRRFSAEELETIWKQIRLNRRVSTIFIFILFLALLYEVVFPRYTVYVNNLWFVNVFAICVLFILICQLTTIITSKTFKKSLRKRFGEFKKVRFEDSENIDSKYYAQYKLEFVKAFVFVVVIMTGFSFISPFKIAQEFIKKERYEDVIRLTTIGAKIFPIAPEWYALKAYSEFQTMDYNSAIEDYDKAYKFTADGFNIMNFDNKIFVRYYIGDYDGAIADFDNEIKNANNENERDQFLWDKAQFLYNIKRYQEALEIYNDLIIKAENDRIFLLKDRLYLERAEVYRSLGQEDLAQKDIESADIDPQTETDFSNPIPKPSIMLDDET